MYEIQRTEVFTSWLDDLRDAKVRVRVLARLDRVAQGVFGDTKVIGETVSELRIDYRPGYRICYTKRRRAVSSCWLAETNPLEKGISSEPFDWHRIL